MVMSSFLREETATQTGVHGESMKEDSGEDDSSLGPVRMTVVWDVGSMNSNW